MQQPRVLILGIGNLLWADEGFGVRAIDALQAQYDYPDNVILMDGGTQGLYLVPHVQLADILVVFDAVDYGLPPGTIKEVHDEDVPKFMGAKKMSLHQTGFQEVLATAELMGDYPKHVFLVGVQPEELDDYGGSLRAITKAQIQPCIDIALNYLAAKGIHLTKRDHAQTADLPGQVAQYAVNHPSLTIENYESERPSAQTACRIGDDRVLTKQSIRFDPKSTSTELESNVAVALGQRLKS
jgi:hydrogenase maturation protease